MTDYYLNFRDNPLAKRKKVTGLVNARKTAIRMMKANPKEHGVLIWAHKEGDIIPLWVVWGNISGFKTARGGAGMDLTYYVVNPDGSLGERY